jgi:hypothetical protein
MLWFFAVAAALAAGLWAAVRLEKGLESTPVGNSETTSGWKPRRCRTHRRPPTGRRVRGRQGRPGGEWPRVPHCDGRRRLAGPGTREARGRGTLIRKGKGPACSGSPSTGRERAAKAAKLVARRGGG